MLRRAFAVGLVTGVLALAGTVQAAPPPPRILTGLDAGWPDVRGWTADGRHARQYAPWGEWDLGFAAYPTYQEGVRVAVGDVDGDGRAEIVTAPGKDAWTELRVFDGRTFAQRNTLLPFKDGVWWAGAYVATADTNGDGRDEIVDGLDRGCCTRLHVLDGVSGADLAGFAPFGDNSDVGVRVAAGDLNGDGRADVIALPVGSARISAFRTNGGTPFRTFDAFGTEATGPTAIAAGDLTGDARAEIVAAAPTVGGAEVKIFDPATGNAETVLYPYGGESVASLAVALGDVDGDGRRDIVVSADTPSGTSVKAFDTEGAQLAGFYVLDGALVPRVSLAAGDLDGDGRAEIVLGGGPTTAPWPPVANGPEQRVAVYRRDGTEFGHFSAYPGIFQGGVRVGLADVGGDARPEMITAPGPGLESEIEVWSQEWTNGLDRGTRLGHFLAFEPSFTGGVSLATGDVDGDGGADIVCGTGAGTQALVRVFDGQGRLKYGFTPFGAYAGGVSVGAGDVDADGRAEIVVGTLQGPAKVRVFEDGVPRLGPTLVPFSTASAGVQVAVADVDGSGHGLIVVGETSGDHPGLSLMNPDSGAVVATGSGFTGAMQGVRVAAGDLDRDGRDEILVASGFGGYATVHVFNGRLKETTSFSAYDWSGAGVNLATLPRIGFPLAAEPRTITLKARMRATVVVARFRDAAGGTRRLAASIAWGDSTQASGKVVGRGGGIYDVRAAKRYLRPGAYRVTVTITDGVRLSVARSRAIVRRR